MSRARQLSRYASLTGLVVTLVLVPALGAVLRGAAPSITIKLATLAPTGTSLHQSLQKMKEKWTVASKGDVAVTIFANGTQGGEAETVRRMRVGQLQAAMLTVQGLAQIDPSVNALEDMPMMFRSLEEVAYSREKLRATIERKFRDKGYVLLFWADTGWVRFFSKRPVVTPADLRNTKLFAWAGNDDQIELMKFAGLKPVSLETSVILTSLKTGLIDAVPTIPLVAQTGQIAGQVGAPCLHMLELNWAPLVGGTVVRADEWNKIAPAVQAEMLKAARDTGVEVTSSSRLESNVAVETMKKRGLTVHAVTPALDAEWRRFAEAFYPKIRGGMVPADLFDEVQRNLEEFRASSRGAR